MLPKVYVTRHLPAAAWQELEANCSVEIWDREIPPPYKTLLEAVHDREGLLCLLTDRIDANLMDAAPDLRVISQCAVGYDNVDVAAASARGIRVGNTPDVLTDATADFAFTLMLSAARRVVEAVDYVRLGLWETWGLTTLLGQSAWGATLGIIGFGRIGQALARRARGFEMNILYHDLTRFPEAEAAYGATWCPLEELLSLADFVSIHTNLTPETRGLIGEAALRRMKPNAVLVNTARWPGGGQPGTLPRPAGRLDRRSRPGRHRPRAAARRAPAAQPAEFDRRPAHCQRHRGFAQPDGADGSAQPGRRRARRTAAFPGKLNLFHHQHNILP